MGDKRYVYGANCIWHGSIRDIGHKTLSGRYKIPCCPHCGGVLFEFSNKAEWDERVSTFNEHCPGYDKFVEYFGQHHFYDIKTALAAYEAATGIKLNIG